MTAITIGFPYLGTIGKPATLELSKEPVKLLTRRIGSGEEQIWHLDGPNKGFWVDKNNKKIDSSNFIFKPPGTLIIKEVTSRDGGHYDFEPLVPSGKVINENTDIKGIHLHLPEN